MLALARKTNQSIMIGNDIEITLLEIKGRPGENRNKCTQICTYIQERNICADTG